MQRFLEEREKSERQVEEKGEADQKVASRGLLRALIITPTRELALQVLLIVMFSISFSVHVIYRLLT